ncbi:nucleoside monophosphate kinase [Candidatus Roizmanbacteria bacterium]|nr:nucleoside monophosphate kinase [Candidatus Roizmanbacteria bacterium]
MNIEILGPRASGKTTLGKMLATELNNEYISLGTLARREVANESKIGKQMKFHIDNKIPYPEGFLIDFIRQNLQKALKNTNGFILDGYPRRVSETLEFINIMNDLGVNLDYLVELNIPLEELIRRSELRLWCPKCDFQIARTAIKTPHCPDCSTTLSRRSDDTPKEIERMYELYRADAEEVKGMLTVMNMVKVFSVDDLRQAPFITQGVIHLLNQSNSTKDAERVGFEPTNP